LLARIAGRQHGLARAEQIAWVGLTREAVRKRVLTGRLHRRYRGVYAVGHAKLSREGEWLAAVFAAGERAALASFSAAFLYRTIRFEPRTIHVIAPRGRRPQAGFELRTVRHLDPRDVTVVNGIPVTTFPRTLVDLTDVMEADDLANVIHEAAFLKLFNEAATRQAMDRARGRKLSVLDVALRMHTAGSAGSKSRNEKRFLKLIRGAGFPEPRQNVQVHGFEVDFVWPGLCVEVDGEGHERARTKADDRIRDAALKARGITVVRISEGDLLQPSDVLAKLATQQLPRSAAG
jgi:very-short-patch-repair endonuclease